MQATAILCTEILANELVNYNLQKKMGGRNMRCTFVVVGPFPSALFISFLDKLVATFAASRFFFNDRFSSCNLVIRSCHVGRGFKR